MSGRSPGSRVFVCFRLPVAFRLQWPLEAFSPVTVAGAAAFAFPKPDTCVTARLVRGLWSIALSLRSENGQTLCAFYGIVKPWNCRNSTSATGRWRRAIRVLTGASLLASHRQEFTAVPFVRREQPNGRTAIFFQVRRRRKRQVFVLVFVAALRFRRMLRLGAEPRIRSRGHSL